MTQVVPQVSLEDEQRRDDPRTRRSQKHALEAARQLLDERGWDAVTHAAVAQRSGLGRSTLYRHWPDTASLLREVIAKSLPSSVPPHTGSLRADLIACLDAFRCVLNDPTSERCMATVVERATVDDSYGRLRADVATYCTRALREVLRAGVVTGELAKGLDVPAAIDELAGPLAFRRLFSRRTVGRELIVRVVDDFLRAHRTARDPGRR